MSRPIVWALGVLAVAAGLSMSVTARLSATAPAPAGFAAASSVASLAAPEPVVLQQDLGGHYKVHPLIDGQPVRMLVDTGATLCAFTQEDAERAGLKVEQRHFTVSIGTANGTVLAAPVVVREVRIGGILARNVEALVLPRGRLGISLLGMSFLRSLRGFEVSGGRLILRG